MVTPNTLVLGASDNPERMSYKAVVTLQRHGLPVIALGARSGNIGETLIDIRPTCYNNIHTVSLYLNPTLQTQYFAYIASLAPSRVICNPGTENEALEIYLRQFDIEVQHACTLVLLSLGQYVDDVYPG